MKNGKLRVAPLRVIFGCGQRPPFFINKSKRADMMSALSGYQLFVMQVNAYQRVLSAALVLIFAVRGFLVVFLRKIRATALITMMVSTSQIQMFAALLI